MTNVMRKAYTEVNEILKYMPKEYTDKVPEKFRRLFLDCKLDDYKVNIDPNKPIEEQKLIYETLVILTILKYNFWCNSVEEKRQMEMQLIENDKKKLNMYDISKLNSRTSNDVLERHEKNNDKDENNVVINNSKNLPMKVEKQSWFSKFIMKIKNIFKK